MRCILLTSFLLLTSTTAFALPLRRRGLISVTGSSGSWTYSGCYVDDVAARALSSAFKADAASMSVETCTAFCTEEGYTVAGVEFSSECWCGTTLPSQVATDPTTCNMPCSGDPMQSCGGPDRLIVYSRPVSSAPQINPGPNGWRSIGCYTDIVGARTLSNLRAAGDQMTVDLCAATCTGSMYFGVEYARECFCSDSILNGGTSTLDGCNMPCKGDTTQFCGGSNRLNLYQAIPPPKPQPVPESSPSPSPEPKPSLSPSPAPEPSPSPSPQPSPSLSPQPSPIPSPESSPIPSPSLSPESSPVSSPNPSTMPSPSPSSRPSLSSSPEPSPSPSSDPSSSPSPSPAPDPSPSPSAQSSPGPSPQPTLSVSLSPSLELPPNPSTEPSSSLSLSASPSVSSEPSPVPSPEPLLSPSPELSPSPLPTLTGRLAYFVTGAFT